MSARGRQPNEVQVDGRAQNAAVVRLETRMRELLALRRNVCVVTTLARRLRHRERVNENLTVFQSSGSVRSLLS
jgi:hypothetical protein